MRRQGRSIHSVAEAHAEEDQRLKELAEVRNQGDALVHSTRKALDEFGDKLDSGEKERIEAAIKDLEDALKGNDKSVIEAKVAALTTAAQKLGEKMYADTRAQQAASDAAHGATQGTESSGAESREDDVVDADFKEVKK